MPVIKNRSVIELIRGAKAFFNFELGLTLGTLPTVRDSSGQQLEPAQNQLASLRRQLAIKNERIVELEKLLTAKNGEYKNVVDPAKIIWIFGSGRTGSTWLSSMMGDLPNHVLWDEPLVGKLFGDLFYALREDRRNDISFILGGSQEARRYAIRKFMLTETARRYGDLNRDKYLVIKEPNGSIGAPLLMEAMPESRMIFLIRDFRDSIASFMAAHKKGGWVYENRDKHGKAILDNNPEHLNLLRRRVKIVSEEVQAAKRAYEAHEGPKALVKYEDLRSDTLEVTRRIYSELNILTQDKDLTRVVEKHAWENIPREQKGAKMRNRKATPGAWRTDLTPQQIKIVENSLSPLVEEFYQETQ